MIEIQGELKNLDGSTVSWKIARHEDTGYFALKDFVPILKQLNDRDFQTDFRLNLSKLQQDREIILDNQQESLLLTKFGILVDTDVTGEKWITADKANNILQKAGILDAFREQLNQVNNQPIKRSQNSLRDLNLSSIDIDEHRELGSPLKKIKFNTTSDELEPIPIFHHDMDPDFFKLPLRLHNSKLINPLVDNAQRLKVESLLQKLLFPDESAIVDGTVKTKVPIDRYLNELDLSFPHVPLNLNVSVDEHGNSPLHWLTSIANLKLVKELVKNGSDRLLGDNNGESPLVKAVKSINNYDSGTFEELLDYLYPCLILVDSMKRSILHHIVITSGVSGCASAAKYYLDILMGWIVKKQNRFVMNNIEVNTNSLTKKDTILEHLDLKWVINNMLNAQDSNGDTCLNIAARLGNVAIVDALLDYGSDPYTANKSGLRPMDFGAGNSKMFSDRITCHSTSSNPSNTLNSIANNIDDDAFFKMDFLREPDTSMLINNMKNMLATVSKDYEMEKNEYKERLVALHQELNMEKNRLALAKERLMNVKGLNDESTLLKEQVKNIQKGIEEEKQNFALESKNLGISAEDSSSIDWDSGEFDADEPFRVDFIYDFLNKKLQNEYNGDIQKLLSEEAVENVMKQIRSTNDNDKMISDLPPTILLKARINAYRKNDDHLEHTLNGLCQKQSNLEGKFKRVLSLCLKVDEDKVDSMLDGLLQAISTEDSQDIDTNEMQDFLNKHAIA